jgi:biotin operon repressor
MPTESITFRPKSLDDIPQAFQSWWAKYHKHGQSRIHFSRRRRPENLLIFTFNFDKHVQLSVQENEMSYELAGRRFHMLLNDFDVSTRFMNGSFTCEFKIRHFAQGPLKESLNAVQKTKNPIFVSRGINAVAELDLGLSKERIEEASAAPTDYMVLLKALTEPSVATQLASEDPLAAARLRGVETQQNMLNASGGVLSGSQVAKILDISRQAVDKRRKQGQLIGLTQGKRGYAYPAWQFEGGKTIAHLTNLLDALRSHDAWMQLAFFINGNDRLNGRSPLELLRAGKLESVLHAARSYGEQGAA